MDDKSKNKQACPSGKDKKDACDNQWTTNNSKYVPDNRERRDGPGGEDGFKK